MLKMILGRSGDEGKLEDSWRVNEEEWDTVAVQFNWSRVNSLDYRKT